jgi:regulator of nucleoside diphosphate kinase
MGGHIMIITDRDRCRLGCLLTSEKAAAFGNSRVRVDLETTLEEAATIPAELTPRELVTMNSTVGLIDLDSGERQLCTLVYPDDRDFVRNSVGILQPLGACLLGRRIGDILEFHDGNRARRLRIDSLPYQPEAAGDIHL